jgi:hypothetical protein
LNVEDFAQALQAAQNDAMRNQQAAGLAGALHNENLIIALQKLS